MAHTDYKRPRDGSPLYADTVTPYGSSGRPTRRCLACSDQAGWYLVLDHEDELAAHARDHEAWWQAHLDREAARDA